MNFVHPFFLFGIVCGASMGIAQSAGTFTATGSMTTPRVYHTATLLADGRVLIAGGVPSAATAELYDPSTGTFATIGYMTTSRSGHTATRLANGTVLLAGGNNAFVSSAEIYDPSTGTFTGTGNMTTPNTGHTATLLADGKVLILAGFSPTASVTNSAEIYDPATGIFTSLPNSNSYFDASEPVLLTDGTVLAGNQIYQPSTGTFTFTKTGLASNEFPPPGDEGSYTASLLLDGTVLTAGGGYLDFSDVCLVNGTLYRPDLGIYTAVGDLKVCRLSHTATLLPSGAVLVAGGWSLPPGSNGVSGSEVVLAESELYDPSTGTFAPSGNMTMARTAQAATLLKDGRILITGGMGPGVLATAEIYNPPVLSPAPVLLSLSGDGHGQGAVQHADTYQLVSASNPAVAGESLIVYFTGLVAGGVIPPQVSLGGRMAEVLWFGDTPGFVGLNQANILAPSGIAPRPAVTMRLTYLDRPSNEVTIGVQ